MKKTLLILSIIAMMATPSYAVLSVKESTSETYLHNHGYSDEMARLVDLQNSQINGVRTNFKSRNPDWYETNKPVKYIRQVFKYLDCALDDEHFGDHSIYFTPYPKKDGL